MNEDNKNVQDTQPEVKEEKVENNVEVTVNEDQISEGVFSRLANMFKNEESNEKIKSDDTKGNEDTSNSSNSKDKEPDIDIDKIVKEQVQETISKMAYETKAKAKKEAEAEKELNAKLENVNEEFKELVAFKIKEDKDFDVEKYLEENPHAQTKKSTTSTNIKGDVVTQRTERGSAIINSFRNL